MVQSLAVSMQANLASVKNPPTKETPSLAKAPPFPSTPSDVGSADSTFSDRWGSKTVPGGVSALQSSSKALVSPG